MRPSRPSVVASLVLPSLVAILAACSDPAAPVADAPALAFVGPATAAPRAGQHPDGSPRVECEATVGVRFTARDAALRARWSGGTAHWAATGRGGEWVEEVTAAELAALWGDELAPDRYLETAVAFWADEPFSVTLDARYTVGDEVTERTATYALRCAPPGPPLTGRWAMTMIDGRRLPTQLGFSTIVVVADTLEFFPNLTYASQALLGANGEERRDMPATAYAIPHADSVALPYFLQHVQAWTASRSGNTLLFTSEGSGGWPGTEVRFDRVGAPPDLPPEPRFVATPAVVALAAVGGGPSPAPLRIAVTSAAPTQLYGLSAGISGTCIELPSRLVCPHDWALAVVEPSATPATLIVTPATTDLPPGTYAATIFLTGHNVPDLAVPVTYTVRAP